MNINVLDWIPWWTWAVATFGLAGVVAAIAACFIVGPAVVLAFIQAATRRLLRFFAWVLSYRLGCALVAAVLAAGAVDFYRSYVDDAACDARIAELQAAGKAAAGARDTEITAEIAKKYADEQAAFERDAAALKTREARLEKKILAGIAAGSCQLGATALKLRKPAKHLPAKR